MKALKVFESISFKKSNSEEEFKKNLEVGIWTQRNFLDKDIMIEWIYEHLTQILKVKKLSRDIISDPEFYFPKKYMIKIQNYIEKYITVRNEAVDLWNSDVNYLRKLVDNKLHESISFKKPESEEEFKDLLFGKIRIYYFEGSYMFSEEDFIGSLEAAKKQALKVLQNQYDYRRTTETLWAEFNVLKDAPSIGDPDIKGKQWERVDTIIFKY